MKYAIDKNGIIEIRQDSSANAPIGSWVLTNEQYDSLCAAQSAGEMNAILSTITPEA